MAVPGQRSVQTGAHARVAADAVQWIVQPFDALSTGTLYAILQLRSAVFVVEQNCVFQDMDGLDAQAIHLTGQGPDGLLAYARCFGPGVAFEEASIGRVITHAQLRGSGLGHALIARAIAAVHTRWGIQPIRIGAQARLRAFYAGHGFVDQQRPYVEDGIDHLEMLWKP